MHTGNVRLFVLSCTLLLAGCDDAPTLSADGASPHYQICSIDGECGPDPRYDPLVGYTSQVSHSQRITYYYDQLEGEESFKGRSYSEIYSTKIASARVDATAYRYPGCDGAAQLHATLSKTVTGIGRAEVNTRFDYNYPARNGFQMVATHTFYPAPGYSGGGTYTSEASECDNFW